MQFPYSVSQQYARGSANLGAAFKEKNDAVLFIKAKLKEDAKLNVNAIYHLAEYSEIVETYDQNSIDLTKETSNQDGSDSSVRSPFSTRPTPPGGQAGSSTNKWQQLSDDEKNK